MDDRSPHGYFGDGSGGATEMSKGRVNQRVREARPDDKLSDTRDPQIAEPVIGRACAQPVGS